MKRYSFLRYLISYILILLRFSLIFKGFQRLVPWLLHHFRIWIYWISSDYTILLKLLDGVIRRFGSHMNVPIHCCFDAGMTQQLLQHLRLHPAFNRSCSIGVPLRYNNDKQKKPLFSRGLSVCRLLFNSFSKLKIDENYKEKRRLFY